MTTHMVLVRAKEYLLNHGWQQGNYGGDGGPRCMLGAVRSVDDSEGDNHPAVQILEGYVCPDGDLLNRWNDAEGRTFGEVIAVFDRAILATAPPKPDESPFTALEDLPPEQYIDCLSTLALIPAEALT